MSTISSGTTSTTTLIHSGDTTGSLVFKTNDTGSGGTTAMTIDTSQQVGIGTSTMTRNVNVGGSGAAVGLSLQNSGTSGRTYSIFSTNSGASTVGSLGFYDDTAGAYRMTIDSSGNVGIGTSSPSYRIDAVGTGTPSTGIIRTSSNLTNSTTKYGYYTVGHYTNATAPFGFIQGESNSTENNVHIGGGAGEVTAATRIDFYTASNNTTTNGTERMRIDSSGNLLVGTTNTTLGSVGCQLFGTGYYQATSNGAPAMILKRGSNDGAIVDFYDSLGNRRGYINVTTSATTYNTISDYRLKENIASMTGALGKVAQLKPVTYTWKANGSDGQGFIAHELQEVIPDCVTGAKDAIDADGNPEYQGIDTSFLVATLTAAIQELKAINDQQAQTITALTARIVALEEK